jgi:adenosine kinase
MEQIIISGSIAYDYLMRFPGRFTDHLIDGQMHQVSLSFLVEEMTKHWGGVGANIAFNLAMLGMRPKLFNTVGRDFPDYRQWLDKAGVDTSTVRQLDEVFTASFFCNTDLDNNQIASFYSGAMSRAGDYRLADVYEGIPDLVLISPSDPGSMSQLAAECRERGIRFMYDPSQQVPRLSGDDLKRDMQGAYAMVVNGYECEVIQQKTGQSLEELRQAIDILVVTHGKDGSTIYANGDIIEVPTFHIDEVKDPTGGGDSFRAGFIRGIAAGLPLKLAGEMGSLVAAYALEHVGTQNHRFTLPEFIARFRTQFDDGGQLNVLVKTATV